MSPDLSPDRRWFFIELWYDIRERFKAILGDGVLFISVLGILEVVDLILGRMQYPAERKHVLESTHFWGSSISLYGPTLQRPRPAYKIVTDRPRAAKSRA